MRAVIKYPGSKWRIAKWIIDHFSPHHSYLEPFFGSGAVLFTKERSNIETVNDLDGNVVNFFQWIQKDPERLSKAIYWKPYARDVFDQACKEINSENDSFNQAVIFCTKNVDGVRLSDERNEGRMEKRCSRQRSSICSEAMVRDASNNLDSR